MSDSVLNTLLQVTRYYSMVTLLAGQKAKFPINDFFSKCDQICSFLQSWLHLVKKSLMEYFIFCAVIRAA